MKKLFISTIVLLAFLCSTCSAIKQSYASTSLIGNWKLDETTQGSDAVDSSGTNTGIPQGTGGGPNPSADVPSTINFSDPKSASFNGTDQYFNCGNTPTNLPSGSEARTISAWIKGNSFADTYGKSIAGWGNDSGGQLSELRINTSLEIEFHGNGNDVAGTTILSTGQWYFVATTVTNDGTVTLYVNGTQDGSGSVNLNTTEANCKIGKQPDFNAQYFDGLIDDVRIYNTALTSTQIANLAAGNESPDTTPTPTPTETRQNTSSSVSSGSSNTPSCTSAPPTGTPDLFQIDTNQTQASLFFAPTGGSVTNYAIFYGYSSDDWRFSTFTNQGNSTGVLSYTLNDLSPNSTYHIKVRAYNDCQPGNWSNEMKITTATETSKLVRYYKNFFSQILSIFPQNTTSLTASRNKTQNSALHSCRNYTVLPGESLWQIASSQLGDGTKYQLIMTSNHLNSTVLHVGQKLKLGC